MKLAFIGGNGHHYLRGALDDAAVDTHAEVPVAGDGHDNAGAKKKLERFPGAKWFDDPVAMLEEAKPDVVNIGAVYGYNGEWVAACLRRDIAVVSDKPIAATRKQLQTIRELCEAKPGRVVVTEFDFRSRKTFRAARQAVLDGHVGEVALATAQKSYRFGSRPAWYAEREKYGGTILWIASHGIDAVRFCTDLRITSAYGRQGNITRPDYGEMEDYTTNLFGLENGGAGIVHADFLRPAKAPTHGDDRIRIAGGKGLVEVVGEQCLLCTHDAEQVDLAPDTQVQPIYVEMLEAITSGGSDLYGTAHSLELAEVMLTAREAADGQQDRRVRNG